MRFVNLDTLKIDKEYRYTTRDICIETSANEGIRDIFNSAAKSLRDLNLERTCIPQFFNIQLEVRDFAADEVDDIFYTFTNTFLSAFVDVVCLDESRKRERRLDVPDLFKKEVRMDRSGLKKLVNTSTVNDVFNISICWDLEDGTSLYYDLLGQDKENESNIIERDFVHSVDELGDKNE